MRIPMGWTIVDGAYALDGGSIFLAFRDGDGEQHELVLVQHRIPMDPSDLRMAGRLYLDRHAVPVRSREETQLLSEIKAASISPLRPGQQEAKRDTGPVVVLSEDIADFMVAARASPRAAIQHLLDSLLEFVESDEYVKLAHPLANGDSA